MSSRQINDGWWRLDFLSHIHIFFCDKNDDKLSNFATLISLSRFWVSLRSSTFIKIVFNNFLLFYFYKLL